MSSQGMRLFSGSNSGLRHRLTLTCICNTIPDISQHPYVTSLIPKLAQHAADALPHLGHGPQLTQLLLCELSLRT